MSNLRLYPERTSGYEELKSYYPRYYRGVLEMEALLRYFGGVCDDIEAQTEQAYLNNFVLTADADTIKSWEDTLHITYKKQLTLDQRRSVVLARLSGTGHIGEPEIRVIVSAYTDCAIAVDFKAGLIDVDIDGEIFDEGNLYDTLLGRIPAHLALRMTARTIRRFPMTLNFCFGADYGQEIQAQPVGRDRAARNTVTVSQGAFTAAHLDIEPPTPKRRQQQAVRLSGGVYQHTKTPTTPRQKDREQRVEIPLKGGGAFGKERQDKPIPPKRSEQSQAKSSGGFYCRTHIKSKLIKEDI